jgi:hypothetical protein
VALQIGEEVAREPPVECSLPVDWGQRSHVELRS